MDLQSLTLYQMSGEKLRWLAQRQTVLAENIANANTPDYMARDIEKLNFKDLLTDDGKMQPARTNPMHRTRSSGTTKIAKTNAAHMSPVPDGKSRVDDRRRADRRVRALRKAVEHCLLLFGRIGRHSGLLNLKMKTIFRL